jgi:hypothetical protein
MGWVTGDFKATPSVVLCHEHEAMSWPGLITVSLEKAVHLTSRACREGLALTSDLGSQAARLTSDCANAV